MSKSSLPFLGRMLCTVALGLAACLPALAGDDTAERVDKAQQAYAQRHWHEAFNAFAELAEQGHPASALRAAQMHRWGPRLYGTRFPVAEGQVARWMLIGRCGPAVPACVGPPAASAVASAETGR